MSNQARGVFICPNCGGPSLITPEGHAACSQCEARFELPEQVVERVSGETKKAAIPAKKTAVQRNITLGDKGSLRDFEQAEKVAEPIVPKADFQQLQEERKKRRRRKKRSKPPLSFYLKWFFVWLGVVGLVLFSVSKLQTRIGPSQTERLTVVGRLTGEEKEFYKREYPRIQSRFLTYSQAKTASQKADFCLKAKRLERKMRNHYKDSSPRNPSLALKTDPVFWNVAFEESPGFVEVVWDGKSDGNFEGVFVKVNDAWVLDWEHYVRYSTETWTVFSKQLGVAREGVFRVYIEKISESEEEAETPWIKVRILPPYEDESRRQLEASEGIRLEADSEVANQIEGLYAERSGESEGFTKLWKSDPKELRRARVALSWNLNEQTGEEKIVINEVLAGHWRTSKEDLEALKEAEAATESKTDE